MSLKNAKSMREYIDFLEKEGELLRIRGEVDPIVEMSAIGKKLDGGPALLFENIKGYPDARTHYGTIEDRKLAKAMGIDFEQIKFKCLDAIKNQVPPKMVKEAPCQEVVITKNIDVPAVLPLIQQSAIEPTPALGGGILLVRGELFGGGSHVGFHRMHFRGKDFSSVQFAPGGHMDQVMVERIKTKERVPVTINISSSAAVHLMAGAGFMGTLLPFGCDELAIAGGLEESAVEIIKARTVDAYAIANSEYVLEGYVNTGERVWETPDAEKLGKQGVAPIHPEWTGYQGRAYRAFKFEVTAITHRKDRPIFDAPISKPWDHAVCAKFREGYFVWLANTIRPGFVIDATMLYSIPVWSGIVLQFRKSWRRDEGFQRNILAACLALSQGLRIAIGVDEDVNIYSADDILWALATRVDWSRDVFLGGSGRGQVLQPAERAIGVITGRETGAETSFAGGIGIDATVPFEEKWRFQRLHHAVETIDLKKWLTKDEIAKAHSMMPEYARYLAETGR